MAKSSPTGRKRVKFEIQADEGSEVYVAGDFNDWSPKKNRLRLKDGVFAASVLLPKGKHQYKFIVNGDWCVDPNCGEWAPNGLGSLNSVRTVG